MRWVVSAEIEGLRLDRALAAWAKLSRRQVRDCLRRGLVELNGQIAPESVKGRSLAAGDILRIRESLALLDTPIANAQLEVDVLDDGEDWIAVDKPSGCGVHPLNPSQDNTVLNALIHRHSRILGVGEGGLRSGVVHRLDVDTSGVLLFAQTQLGFDRLRSAFREHHMAKTYWALVEGGLDAAGEVELALRVRRHRPALVEVTSPGRTQARCCRTSWRVLERSASHSLVELHPLTGHLHQIRVTLAHLGTPIVGDAVYGRPLEGGRQMLHARRIHFEEIDVESPLPSDFERCRREVGCG